MFCSNCNLCDSRTLLSMHILQNLGVFEYMKRMLESHLMSQQLHLIHTLRGMLCHELQTLVCVLLTSVHILIVHLMQC